MQRKSAARDQNCVSSSSLSEQWVLGPFWNFIVFNILPAWLPPNFVTLTGLACLFGLWGFTLALDDRFSGQLPPGPAAILLFAYQTCDGIDGIQARRVGKATIQGAFLDHTVDAFAVTIAPCVMAAATGDSAWLPLDIFNLQGAFLASNLLLVVTGRQAYNYLDAQDLILLSVLVLVARAAGFEISLPMTLVRFCCVCNIFANVFRTFQARYSWRGLVTPMTAFMMQVCFGLRLLALQSRQSGGRESALAAWVCLQTIVFAWFMSDILNDQARGYVIQCSAWLCASVQISFGAMLLAYAGYQSCSVAALCVILLGFFRTFSKRFRKLVALDKRITDINNRAKQCYF